MSGEEVEITIENLGTIKRGTIHYLTSALNVKYGLNGTGKSTISDAIVALSKGEELSRYRTFGQKDTPKVNMRNVNEENKSYSQELQLNKVAVFNTDYVNQYLFKEDLARNSYEIFVNTPEYQAAANKLDDYLVELYSSIKNDKIIELKQKIESVLEDLKFNSPNKSGVAKLAKSSKVMKGRDVAQIDCDLADSIKGYAPYLKSPNSPSWIKWFLEGTKFMETDECPYCLTHIRKDEMITNSKAIEHTASSTQLKNSIGSKEHYSDIQGLLSKKEKEIYAKMVNTSEELSNDDYKTVFEIRSNLETQKKKLVTLQTLDKTQLKHKFENNELRSFLESNKLDFPNLSKECEDIKSSIEKINDTIDKVLEKEKNLLSLTNNFAKKLNKSISDKVDEINNFLQIASIPYEIEVQDYGDQNYSTILKSIQAKKKVEASYLSYGEKNLISLILFVYDALKENADLIILDDPVSSFDNTKKYAMLYYLFAKENALLKNKTVLMFTHDFEIVADLFIKNKLRNQLPLTKCSYIYTDTSSVLTEQLIDKNTIKYTFEEWEQNAKNKANSKIRRIVNLRKICELDRIRKKDDSSIKAIESAYNILSNLEHLRPDIDFKKEKNNKMSSDEVTAGLEYIKNYIEDFDYNQYLKDFRNIDVLVELYNKANNASEKLQITRIVMNNVDHKMYDKKEGKKATTYDEIFRDFITEAYHIENNMIITLPEDCFERVPRYIVAACDEYIEKVQLDEA